MSNIIEDKVVQMAFEDDSFTSGVEDSLKSINELKDGLNFEDSVKGLDNIDAEARSVNFDGISAGVEALKERFSLMGIVGITVIQNITNKLIDLAQGFIDVAVGAEAIRGGFAEYEAGIKSFQTILSNTESSGETIDTVTNALEILNGYANKTTYSFGDMNNAIGKFSAQGVKLDQSLTAIKGIYNLVSLTGGNAEKANQAISSLAQGLASGRIRLRQWESLVSAGIANPDFQEELKNTARIHGVAIDEIIADQGSLRDSLNKDWLTSEILLDTLAKYTGDLSLEQLKAAGYSDEQAQSIYALGQRALSASTKVKTLSQLTGLLRSNMVTSWAQSFRIIVGNLDEASALWTQVGEILGNIFQASADARNELLQGWKDLGGRQAVIDALTSAFEELSKIVKPIGEAFREIFPPLTAQKLYDLTVQFKNLVTQFKIGEGGLANIKKVFKGVFSLVDIGRMLVLSLVKALFGLSGGLKPVTTFLKDNILALADYIINLRETIINTDAFTVGIQAFVSFISGAWTKVKQFFTKITDALHQFAGASIKFDGSKITDIFIKLSEKFKPLSGLFVILGKIFQLIGAIIAKAAPIFIRLGTLIGDAFSKILDGASNFLDNFNVDDLLRTLNLGFFAALVATLKNFIKNGPSLFVDIRFMLSNLGTTLAVWQNTLKAETLIKIATAIGILALALIGLTFVDPKRLAAAVATISAMFVELGAALKGLTTIKASGVKLTTLTIAVVGLSAAVLILAGAIAIVASLDPQKIGIATLALSGLLGLMVILAKSLAGSTSFVGTAASVLIFAVGLNIVALALKQLGKMKPEQLSQGLLAMVAVLTELTLFSEIAGGGPPLIGTAIGLTILAGALLLLMAPLTILAYLPLTNLIQGLIGMAAALTLIAATMTVMPPTLPITAAGLLILSGAMVILAFALKTMGDMDWNQFAVAIASMTASLVILTVAMSAMSGLLGGAAALLVAAGAIAILAVSLKAMSTLGLGEIGLAILAIAGVLTVLGVAAYLLTPLIPSLFGLAAALVLIGIASLATGVGVLALSVGITGLSVAFGTLGAGLVVFLTSIISIFPVLGKQVGAFLISLITTLGEGTFIIVDTLVKIVKSLLEGLKKILPDLLALVLDFITQLIVGISDHLPEILSAGYDILLALLHGVEDHIEEIVRVVVTIIAKFIRTLGEETPKLVDAGYDAIVAFINGLADSVEKNIPRLVDAFNHLGRSIVTGIISGIVAEQSGIFQAVISIGQGAINAFAGSIDSNSPSKKFFEQGSYISRGVADGIKQFAGTVYDEADKLGNTTVSAFGSTINKLSDAIQSEVDLNPSIRPVMDLTDVIDGSSQIGGIVDGMTQSISSNIGQVGAIANLQHPVDAAVTDNVPQKGSTIQLTQNNYSPKALSRYEIYRQTKNQLLQIKGLEGVS